MWCFQKDGLNFAVSMMTLMPIPRWVVSPEDDIELRRTTLTNLARWNRTIEVTSYTEVVLAPPMAHALHPAFSNLFVETEIIKEQQAILCTRRPRSQKEQPPFMLHLMAIHGQR